MYRTILPQVAGRRCSSGSIWALLATGALLLYFQLRSRALSPAITEARLQALQARIRPHFLFNSINAVLSLVRSEPARAEEALQDMAELFRVLMRDNRELAPLADEVELCRQYLELEQLRLGERLQVDWNVKSMPGDALVPPLVLQPLLENAVYHGIEPSSAAGDGVDQPVPVARRSARDPAQPVSRRRRPPSLGQQDGAGQRARAAGAALRRGSEPRVARDQGRLRSAHPHARTGRHHHPCRRSGQVPRNGAAARGANGKHAAPASRCGEGGRRKPTARAMRASRSPAGPPMAEPMLRVLVVDDEAPARRRLRDLLDDCGGALPLVVVGEAQHGREALDLLQSAPADLVLTDIHMPDMDGIELAKHLLKLAHPPVVIFTTAFHEHAVQAFEVNAIDYLMKPVRVQRLLAALQKVPKLKPVTAEKLAQLPASARRFLSVTERSRVVLVPLDDIVYLKAELKYITIRTPQREYLLEESLTKLEGEFGGRFVRVHRNCLVARDYIRGFERRVNDDGDSHWEVLLTGVAETLPVSRRQQFVVRDVGRK